jgi:hypothetical protein
MKVNLKTYREIEDAACSVGMSRSCKEVLEQVRLSLPCSPRTTTKAIGIFEKWFEGAGKDCDFEMQEMAYCMIVLFKNKLKEKLKDKGIVL